MYELVPGERSNREEPCVGGLWRMLHVIDVCAVAHAPQHDYREGVRATLGKPSRRHASQDRNCHYE